MNTLKNCTCNHPFGIGKNCTVSIMVMFLCLWPQVVSKASGTVCRIRSTSWLVAVGFKGAGLVQCRDLLPSNEMFTLGCFLDSRSF